MDIPIRNIHITGITHPDLATLYKSVATPTAVGALRPDESELIVVDNDATLAELDNFIVEYMHLEGPHAERLCIHARYRGADCKFKLQHIEPAANVLSVTCDENTPAALRPTHDQLRLLYPALHALAFTVFPAISQELPTDEWEHQPS